MVNYTELSATDLSTIIRYKFNEEIHISSKDLASLQIYDLESRNFVTPIGINPIMDRKAALSFYNEASASMDQLAIIVHRLYISGADLFLMKVRDNHFKILVQYSPISSFKSIGVGMKLYENIDEITSVETLNELDSYFDRHLIEDNTDKNLIHTRILEKYIELYLNTADVLRPKWQGKLITGTIDFIEVDMHKTEMIITYKGFKYTATVNGGLKYSQAIIPQDVLNVFNKYIISEVGVACKSLLRNYPYAPVTFVT